MDNKELVCLLKKARNLITNFEDWCTGTLIKYKNNGQGETYCAIGAVCKAGGFEFKAIEGSEVWPIRQELNREAERLYPWVAEENGIISLNDRQYVGGHDKVLKVFDSLIAKKEAEGQG